MLLDAYSHLTPKGRKKRQRFLCRDFMSCAARQPSPKISDPLIDDARRVLQIALCIQYERKSLVQEMRAGRAVVRGLRESLRAKLERSLDSKYSMATVT